LTLNIPAIQTVHVKKNIKQHKACFITTADTKKRVKENNVYSKVFAIKYREKKEIKLLKFTFDLIS